MPGTRTVNRITAIILSIIMAVSSVFILTGCSVSAGSGPANEPGKVISETENEITITDQAGREVTVGRDIDSIALCYRVVIRFLLNLGQGDKITGIGKSEPFLEKLQPSLKDCMDVGKGVADIEALAELKPDLFIHKASDTETLDAVSKLGIPSIGIEVETPDDMLVAMDILGKILGAEDKASELSGYYMDSVKASDERSETVPEDERKTAIVMGSSIGKVADGTMLQGTMIEHAGGVNAARDLEASELWPTAGTEQIFSWNPDYIFITGGASYSPQDIYSDPAWSEMKAVKDRHVYLMPSEADSWEFPGVVSSLGIEYMQSVMYPDLLPEEQLVRDVENFYEAAYGASFSREELGF